MGRIAVKGLLLKNIDDIYQNIIESCFQNSKLPREEFSKLLENKIDEISAMFDESVIMQYKKNYTVKLSFFHKGILALQKAMARKFERPFQFYFSYLSACHHIMKNVLEALDSQNHNQTDALVISLFGQLLRRADQIGIMLLNGYTDGAMVLWRSYYEYALTTKLLAEQDNNDLSIRFIRHNVRHSKRLSDAYDSRLVSQGFEKIDEEDSVAINQAYNNLIIDYGKDFTKDEYGWANELPGLTKKATFKDVEEFVNMGKYRPFYIWASAYAHANFEVFKSVTEDDKIDVTQIKEIQPDLEELLDPMQITLGVLQETTESLLHLICDDNEVNINCDLLYELHSQLIESFKEP